VSPFLFYDKKIKRKEYECNKMKAEHFSIFEVAQEKSYCGPCSMSYCFFILGKYAAQTEIAEATDLSWWQRKISGCDELSLKRAADAFNVNSDFLRYSLKSKGGAFVRELKKNLAVGNPAVLCVDNFAHWIALLGYNESEDKFIINDPNEDNIFGKYKPSTLKKRCWNEDEKNNDTEYFAIIVSSKDYNDTQWTLTEDFIKLCNKGSAQSAIAIMNDLFEIAERAHLTYPHPIETIKLSVVLNKYEDVIVDNVNHWSKSKDLDKRELRELYRDFTIIAEAANITLAKNFDSVSIVSQMSAILCAALWNEGKLI